MNIIKRIPTYVIWVLVSLLSAFGYARIILGSKSSEMFDWIYSIAMISVGTMVGSIVALLYVFLDIYYLKEKLKSNSKKVVIRFLIIIMITIIVGTIHYILEKGY